MSSSYTHIHTFISPRHLVTSTNEGPPTGRSQIALEKKVDAVRDSARLVHCNPDNGTSAGVLGGEDPAEAAEARTRAGRSQTAAAVVPAVDAPGAEAGPEAVDVGIDVAAVVIVGEVAGDVVAPEPLRSYHTSDVACSDAAAAQRKLDLAAETVACIRPQRMSGSQAVTSALS